jgi:hypothetical protein
LPLSPQLPEGKFFKPKIPTGVNFGVFCYERCWEFKGLF